MVVLGVEMFAGLPLPADSAVRIFRDNSRKFTQVCFRQAYPLEV
jgi:hypothetical protein